MTFVSHTAYKQNNLHCFTPYFNDFGNCGLMMVCLDRNM